MKLFIKILLGVITVLFLISCKGGKLQQETKAVVKPNILFIAIDDLRPELGCYGATQVISPSIDKLAGESLIFNRAYCNIPVCGASRASLMTGILPTKDRFVDYLSRADEDVPNAQTLPQVLKSSGYTTLSNGKIFHNSRDASDRSWSEKPWQSKVKTSASFDPTNNQTNGKGRIYESPDVDDNAYADAKTAEKTINDLKRLKEAGKPFFLACGFVRPHLPFYAPKKYWDLYNRDSIQIATNRYRPENAPKQLNSSGEFRGYNYGEYDPKTEAFHKMMKHGYLASVSYSDKLVGDVLKELERLGLAENTIVVIWGDHGWHLGEHEFWGKHNTLHNALQVPLIIKVPGVTSGKHTKALVETVDVFPTLCELAKVEIPASVMGISFKGVLKDPTIDFREGVYARFKVADAIVTKGFNYSIYENGEEMLYNHKIDPQENVNVIADPVYAEILVKIRAILKEKQHKASAYQK